jgi:hypothetical protein
MTLLPPTAVLSRLAAFIPTMTSQAPLPLPSIDSEMIRSSKLLHDDGIEIIKEDSESEDDGVGEDDDNNGDESESESESKFKSKFKHGMASNALAQLASIGSGGKMDKRKALVEVMDKEALQTVGKKHRVNGGRAATSAGSGRSDSRESSPSESDAADVSSDCEEGRYVEMVSGKLNAMAMELTPLSHLSATGSRRFRRSQQRQLALGTVVNMVMSFEAIKRPNRPAELAMVIAGLVGNGFAMTNERRSFVDRPTILLVPK